MADLTTAGAASCSQRCTPALAPRRAPCPQRRQPAAGQHTRRVRCRSQGQELQTAAGASASPLDIILNDFSYVEDRTGLHLMAPIEAVAGAHDEVVAALNPIAGEQMQRQLEEQIAGMQHELSVAHSQIHRSEERLRESVQHLTELEGSVRQAFGGVDASLTSSKWDLASAAAPPSRSSSSGSSRNSGSAGKARALAVDHQLTPLESQQQQQAVGAALPPFPPPQQRRQQRGRKPGGLSSSLEIPEQLKDYWFPAEFSASLGEGKMVPFELFGQMWVMFRDENGAAACVRDECAHRACPLSIGAVVDGKVRCPYHGWEYDREGACTKMPSTSFCKGIKVEALPVVEADGLVWIWPGSPEAITGPPPEVARPPTGFQIHAELVMDVPVEHGLLLENLLDLAHAPFTHTSTFAKGWPVPDVVKFNAGQLLGGNWEPYPIDMQFGPPCMVLSTIGLTSPGKIERGARASSCKNHLHQLHVCLPSSEGRTRLLYRMSLDFMHWTRYVPAIDKFWQSIAAQVLGEDLVLVQGQQDRMMRGADVWANPVSYDKLGVRYRRWRNSVASGDPSARWRAETSLRQMSAGELFSPEDSTDEP